MRNIKNLDLHVDQQVLPTPDTLGMRAYSRDMARGSDRCLSECHALEPRHLCFPPWLSLGLSIVFPGIYIRILVLYLLVYITTVTPWWGAP